VITLAAFGECMAELSGRPFSQTSAGFGGDTLNTALYFSRLNKGNFTCSYVTALGEDPLSDAMLQAWKEENINIELVLRSPEKNVGLYYIETTQAGERSFSYWRNDSAARQFFELPQTEQCLEKLFDFDFLYISGITAAIFQDQHQFIPLLTELRKHGVAIIFDSNYRPKLWRSVLETRQHYEKILANCTIALVTDEDEHALWGDANIKETIQRTLAHGVHTTVVKQGRRGCSYASLEKHHLGEPTITHIQADHIDKVVDTTSAGDAFNAGFLHSYLSGQDLSTACKMGNKLAGIVIQYPGAIAPKDTTHTL